MRDDFKRTWLATAMCCISVVVTGFSIENPILSLSISAALCIGLLFYAVSACGSRIKVAKLLLLNSCLLALIFALLQVTLTNAPDSWHSLYRIYCLWWLSQRSAIILALIAAGLLAIEAAGKIGGDTTRRRFQRGVIAAASILVAVNIANFLRPVDCADCFFPYGLPFTLFREGGYAGGGGFVWTGLLADAALIPAFATISTLLWNQIAE